MGRLGYRETLILTYCPPLSRTNRPER
jgi:hypothetical protein